MEIIELLRAGEVSLLFIVLSAFTIGALHGLEPGHSRTMMAAFIASMSYGSKILEMSI